MFQATARIHRTNIVSHYVSETRTVYAWYVVAVLMLANTVSFVDRQILNLLVEPIKADLGFTDVEISALQGIAFALFYATMGIPIARLADLSSRKLIISLGVACWSIATAACGLAKTFTGLFTARMLVGVGESSLSPAAYSMVADLFPKNRMAKPMGVFGAGIFAGGGLAYMVGGKFVEWAYSIGNISLPLFGQVAPWAFCFLLVGGPLGLVMLMLLATIKEPERHVRPGARQDDLSIKAVLTFIRSRLLMFVLLFSGLALIATMVYGIHAWTPAFFMREFDIDLTEFGDLGVKLGSILMVCGGAGVYCGGWLADRLYSRGRNDAHILTMMAVAAGLCVSIPLYPLMPSEALVYVAFGVVQFIAGAPVGVAAASIQLITPNRMRGQVTAFYLLIVNLVGAGLGPMIVAFFTDYVFMSEQKLGLSLAMFGAVFGPLALLLLWSCRKMYAAEVAQASY